MLDRSRVALRNYAEGMRFSTYPAFGPAGPGGAALFSPSGPLPGRTPSAPDAPGVTAPAAGPDRLVAMAEILNAHGSKNDIFVAAMTPRDFASDDDLRAFVRHLCDRAGPFGGDGVLLLRRQPADCSRPGSSTRTARPPSSAGMVCAAWAGSCWTGAAPTRP